MKSLIKELKKVKDFRRSQARRHPLWLVLLIVVLGTMQGYLGYRALGDFAKANQKSLVKNFNLPSGQVPSYSTIRRVLLGVNWLNLQDIFNHWARNLGDSDSLKDWVCVDGKTLRSTVSNYKKNCQNFVSLVSFYSQSHHLVLGLNRFENKHESEIRQVQGMVKTCNFKNKVFTLDALHCQKLTTHLIIESGNDYLVAVKKNQKRLYENLESLTKEQEPISQSVEKEQSHGRIISRKVSVFEIFNSLENNWCGIRSLIRVERIGKRGDKDYHQVAYYISSLKENAEVFAQKIRGHWQIENQLHWVKDVILKEDSSPLHNFQARTNLSILQTISINLFRLKGFLSITEGQRWLNNRWSKLLVFLE